MKKLCLSILTCFVFALSTFILIGCDKDKKGNTTNQVPVYQGMSIAKNNRASIMSATLANGNSDISLCAMDDDDFEYEDDDDLDEDIEDIVQIEVKGDETTKYYVQPKEVFIVQVHIDNPSSYEIQSFTLNGSKYANYMFKDGSTMELLLLEVTAPSTAGYLELTIDAIKYIDGTEIKDVRLDGEKTIKAGVVFTQAPTASLSNVVVSTTSVSFDTQITDTQNVIGNNEIKAYLSNGAEIVAEKEIEVGANNVTFDNLLMGTTYEIGIATSYDYIDGYGVKAHWLLTQTVSTQKAFMTTDATVGQTTIDFTVQKLGYVGELTKIELIDGVTNATVKTLTDTTLRSFDSLLSNHPYKIALHFAYENNGTQVNDTSVISFTTRAKTVPTIAVTNDNVTDTTVKGTLSVTDIDNICAVNSVKLYKGEAVVATNEQKKVDFSGLEYYTDYKVVVNYSYDLNDGVGVQTKEFIKEYKTSPYLMFTSCDIINTSVVMNGDTIYIQANIENPFDAIPVSVVVNGLTYNCASSTNKNKVYIEIVNNGQFEGGETNLTIEQLNMSLDGKNYSVYAEENNCDSIFINGILSVVSFDIVDALGEKVEYLFREQEAYFLITLNNKTEYNIDSISISNYSREITTNLIKVNNQQYKIPFNTNANYNGMDNGYYPFWLDGVAYSNEYLNKSLSVDFKCCVIILKTDTITEIDSIDTLLNTDYSTGGYYKLTADLDLSDIEWTNLGKLEGVFDGNGHTLSNMRNVSTFTNQYVDIGLFSHLDGLVKNVAINNVSIIITLNSTDNSVYWASVGVLAADADGNIYNCYVNGDISVSNNTGYTYFDYIGGLVASSSGTVNNCYAIVNITYRNDSSANRNVGGLVGYLFDSNIINSYTVSNYALIGCPLRDVTIKNSFCNTMFTSMPEMGIEVKSVNELTSVKFQTTVLGWSTNDWIFTEGQHPTLK